MYEKHESYGVLKLSKQALKKESDMINQSKETNAAMLQRHYLQAAGLFHAQNQQYAQICSAVQQQSIKDYHQLQYLAERQRHQELEQIKTKERNQESANASRAVKQRLQEVIMARQLKPSNQADQTVQPNSWHTGSAEFPLRKTGKTSGRQIGREIRVTPVICVNVGAKFETAIPIKAETGATQFATHDTKDRPLTVLGHVE